MLYFTPPHLLASKMTPSIFKDKNLEIRNKKLTIKQLEIRISKLNDDINELEKETHDYDWVFIVDMILSEISDNCYKYPFKIETIDIGDGPLFCNALIIRNTHMMIHLSHSKHLKERVNIMPIKTARKLYKEMKGADILVGGKIERSIKGNRISGMMVINLDKLNNEYGLYLPNINRFRNTHKKAY